MLTVSASSLPTAFAKKPATTSATVGLLSLLLQTCTLSILTKMMKLQHEKKPVLNLKNREKERERLGFEQTFTKFIEIFVLQK